MATAVVSWPARDRFRTAVAATVTADYLNSQRLRLVSRWERLARTARAHADKDADTSVKGIRAEAAMVIASLVSVSVARGTRDYGRKQ
jgi:hypothetical protein